MTAFHKHVNAGLTFIGTCLFLIFSMPILHAKTPIDKQALFFCGSAVRVPMDEIIEMFQKKTGSKISVIYSGSGGLLAQMQLSKKGDLYLCGSPDYIEIGEKKGLLIKGTDKKIAYLVPAIIVPRGNPKKIQSLHDLARSGTRIGMGNPETVCLGLYGVELLEYNRLLEPVMPNVVVFAKSCEDTAMLAVLNKVDAIFGWDVFASWNPKEVDWIHIEKHSIPRIAYIAVAIPVFVKNRTLAEALAAFMCSKQGSQIFKKWGYLSDETIAKKQAPNSHIGGEYVLPKAYYQLLNHEK